MMKHTIIIDCDPGIDDALAIMMALAAPDELDIAGITTVGGNVGVAETTRNALALAALSGRRVPVARGADHPLVVEKSRAVSVHGADGLGGVKLPEPAWAVEEASAWEFIRDAADRLDGRLELVAIGPLTNVAIALAAYPRLARTIRAIHMMGGSAGLGNVTPAAEFNTYVDPHAAAAVFQSGIPIVMYGLDVTSRAALTAPGLEELRRIGGRVLTPICSMLDHYMAAYRKFGRDTLALPDDSPAEELPCRRRDERGVHQRQDRRRRAQHAQAAAKRAGRCRPGGRQVPRVDDQAAAFVRRTGHRPHQIK
jgi:inosine-uridine nucleoside N-ribohydrolase